MDKIVSKYKEMKSIRSICLDNNVDYSNFLKGKVPDTKRKKVILGIKKEICKLVKVIVDEY